jgi:hypothetical protein
MLSDSCAPSVPWYSKIPRKSGLPKYKSSQVATILKRRCVVPLPDVFRWSSRHKAYIRLGLSLLDARLVIRIDKAEANSGEEIGNLDSTEARTDDRSSRNSKFLIQRPYTATCRGCPERNREILLVPGYCDEVKGLELRDLYLDRSKRRQQQNYLVMLIEQRCM